MKSYNDYVTLNLLSSNAADSNETKRSRSLRRVSIYLLINSPIQLHIVCIQISTVNC